MKKILMIVLAAFWYIFAIPLSVNATESAESGYTAPNGITYDNYYVLKQVYNNGRYRTEQYIWMNEELFGVCDSNNNFNLYYVNDAVGIPKIYSGGYTGSITSYIRLESYYHATNEKSTADYIFTNDLPSMSAWTQSYSNIEFTGKIFSSAEALTAYYVDGDSSGWINKSDFLGNLDFADEEHYDENYTFINLQLVESEYEELSVSARLNWDSHTERSYLLDEDVYFCERIEVGFASVDAPNTIISTFVTSGEWTPSLYEIVCSLPSENTFVRYIKVLPYYTTPSLSDYYYGKSSTIYMTSDGLKDDKVITERKDLTSFKLNNVSYSTVGAFLNIKWNGVTDYTSFISVPDADTLVTITAPYYSMDLESHIYGIGDTTIGNNRYSFNLSKFMDLCTNNGWTWDGRIWLSPAFVQDGIYYNGEPVVIDIINGTINDVVPDIGTGEVEMIPIEDVKDSSGDIFPNVDYTNTASLIDTFSSTMKSIIAGIGDVPAMLSAVFVFMPSYFIKLISISFVILFVLRILGR